MENFTGNGLVDRKSLKVRASAPDGSVTQYGLELENVQFGFGAEEVTNLNYQLRQILRAEANLESCHDVLRSLLLRRSHGHTFIRNDDDGHRARFAFAAILYGACFVRGENRKQWPLHALRERIEEDPIHHSVMDYRHKLFAHIDANSELREDALLWNMRLHDGMLLPIGQPHIQSRHTLLLSGEETERWQALIIRILGMISELRTSLVDQINALVGPISIRE